MTPPYKKKTYTQLPHSLLLLLSKSKHTHTHIFQIIHTQYFLDLSHGAISLFLSLSSRSSARNPEIIFKKKTIQTRTQSIIIFQNYNNLCIYLCVCVCVYMPSFTLLINRSSRFHLSYYAQYRALSCIYIYTVMGILININIFFKNDGGRVFFSLELGRNRYIYIPCR